MVINIVPPMQIRSEVKPCLLITLLVAMVTSCAKPAADNSGRPEVSVSIPVAAYFAQRLSCGAVDVNVLVPQAAGHTDYSPRPSQMMALARSQAYLAIGALDFEIVWRERMQDAAPQMLWVDLSAGTRKISGHCSHGHAEEAHEAVDPHYWLSPRQAKVMARNMAQAIVNIIPEHRNEVGAALDSLLRDIDSYDRQLDAIARMRPDTMSFMIYHPALTYVAGDYGMRQYEIERDGNAPSPQSYMADRAAARAAGVRVVFVQKGYDVDKARAAAEAIGAQVVEFAPEGYDYDETMNLIISTLREWR